jgi:hypothetical protein
MMSGHRLRLTRHLLPHNHRFLFVHSASRIRYILCAGERFACTDRESLGGSSAAVIQ